MTTLDATTSLWQQLQNWDWDFAPLIAWAKTTVHFWLTVHPWVTWPVVVAVGLVVLLSFEITHDLVTVIVKTLLKGIMIVAITVPTLLLWKLSKVSGAQFMARFRDAWRYFRGLIPHK